MEIAFMEKSLLFQLYSHPAIHSEELQKIVDAHTPFQFKKGDFLLKEGDIANSYLVLNSGLIRAFAINYNAEDITTDFFSDHELVIDVLSLFQRIPTQESIQALTDGEGWMIEFPVFQQLFEEIPGFAEWGRLWMTKKLFAFKMKSIEIATMPSKERYLKLIKEKPEIIRSAPLKHIATYLGITDTSLSRIRKEI